MSQGVEARHIVIRNTAKIDRQDPANDLTHLSSGECGLEIDLECQETIWKGLLYIRQSPSLSAVSQPSASVQRKPRALTGLCPRNDALNVA